MTVEELRDGQKIIDSLIQSADKTNEAVLDGPFDFRKYAEASLKILFFMREPNSYNDGGWDYKDVLLKHDHFFGIFNAIAECVINKKTLEEVLTFLKDNWDSEIHKKEAIYSIAFTNINNIPGGSLVGKNGSIEKLAENNKKIIKEKLIVYNPDIIISPDTDVPRVWEVFKSSLEIEDDNNCIHFDRNGEKTHSDDLFIANYSCLTKTNRKITILGTYHPSAAKWGQFSADEWITAVVNAINWSRKNFLYK